MEFIVVTSGFVLGLAIFIMCAFDVALEPVKPLVWIRSFCAKTSGLLGDCCYEERCHEREKSRNLSNWDVIEGSNLKRDVFASLHRRKSDGFTSIVG